MKKNYIYLKILSYTPVYDKGLYPYLTLRHWAWGKYIVLIPVQHTFLYHLYVNKYTWYKKIAPDGIRTIHLRHGWGS
jgi:hypothetical protein